MRLVRRLAGGSDVGPVGGLVGWRCRGVGVRVVGEGVGGEGSGELADGEHAAEVADLVVDPPGCSLGDGCHLVDGEFASAERVDAVGEFVGPVGDGDDLAGPLCGEAGTPGEEQLGGVDAGAPPATRVGDHRDGEVDEAGVRGVEVPGNDVQFLVEIELRFRRSGTAGCLIVAAVCGFVRCALGSGHTHTLSKTSSRKQLESN